MSAVTKLNAIVVGGCGSLGRSYFKSITSKFPKATINITTIDYSPHSDIPEDVNFVKSTTDTGLEITHQHITLDPSISKSLLATNHILPILDKNYELTGPTNIVVNTGGSWGGSSFPKSITEDGNGEDFGEYLEAFTPMMASNFDSTVLATAIASRYFPTVDTSITVEEGEEEKLTDPALLVLTGADGALHGRQGRTGMAGYVAAKGATNQFCSIINDHLHKAIPVMIVHPTVIDTPNNRMYMPDSDFSTWNDGEKIANHVMDIYTKKVEGREKEVKNPKPDFQPSPKKANVLDYCVVTVDGETKLNRLPRHF